MTMRRRWWRRRRTVVDPYPAGTAVRRARLIRDAEIEAAARKAIEALDAGRRRRNGRRR